MPPASEPQLGSGLPPVTPVAPDRPGSVTGRGWLVVLVLIGSVTLAAFAIRAMLP